MSGGPGVKIVLGAVLAVAVLAGCQTGGGGISPSSQGESGAYNACKKFVKDDLKAPSTASFADHSVSQDGSTYTVTGQVDAENSFGAKIRNDYTCTVTDTGDSWHLENVDVSAP